jgi:hypothetical protein
MSDEAKNGGIGVGKASAVGIGGLGVLLTFLNSYVVAPLKDAQRESELDLGKLEVKLEALERESYERGFVVEALKEKVESLERAKPGP